MLCSRTCCSRCRSVSGARCSAPQPCRGCHRSWSGSCCLSACRTRISLALLADDLHLPAGAFRQVACLISTAFESGLSMSAAALALLQLHVECELKRLLCTGMQLHEEAVRDCKPHASTRPEARSTTAAAAAGVQQSTAFPQLCTDVQQAFRLHYGQAVSTDASSWL